MSPLTRSGRLLCVVCSFVLISTLGGCRVVAGYGEAPDAGSADGLSHRDGGPDARDLSAGEPPKKIHELFFGETGHFTGRAVASATITATGQPATDAYVVYVGSLLGQLEFAGCQDPIDAKDRQAAAIVVFRRASKNTLSCVWAKAFSSTSDTASFEGVAIDATNGRVVAVGHTKGSINFGGGVLAHVGAQDAVMAAFDLSSGTFVANELWGNNGNEIANAVAIDGSSGDALAVGSFSSSKVNFGGSEVDNSIVLTTEAFALRYSFAKAAVKWARKACSTPGHSAAKAVTLAQGKIFIAGTHASSMLANSDMLLSRLGGDGGEPWQGIYGSVSADAAEALATDPVSHDVYVAGHSKGKLVLGSVTLPAGAQRNGFVVSLSSKTSLPSFIHGYRTQGSTTLDSQALYSIAVDEKQRPVACGRLNGGLVLSTSPQKTLAVKAGSEGFCVVLDQNLGLQDGLLVAGGGHSLTSDQDERVLGAALLPAANGNTRQLAIAGRQSGLETLNHNSLADLRYRLPGSHVLSEGELKAVVVDPRSPATLYVAGYLKTGYATHFGRGGDEGFVARFELTEDRGLIQTWIAFLSGTGEDRLLDLAVDGSRVYVVGSYQASAYGETTLGPRGVPTPLPAPTLLNIDGLVAALEPASGKVLWHQVIASTKRDESTSVTLDSAGSVIVATSFRGTLSKPAMPDAGPGVLLGRFHSQTGQLDVSHVFTSSKEISVGAVATSAASNALLLAGRFEGSMRVTPMISVSSAGVAAFLLSLDDSFNVTFAQALDSQGDPVTPQKIISDGRGTWLLGTFHGRLTVDKQSVTNSSGSPDGFVLSLEPAGKGLTLGELVVFQGDGVELVDGLNVAGSADDDNKLVLFGSYRGQSPFGKANAQTPFLAAFDLPLTSAASPSWVIRPQEHLPARAAAMAHNGERFLLVGAGTRALGLQPWLIVTD